MSLIGSIKKIVKIFNKKNISLSSYNPSAWSLGACNPFGECYKDSHTYTVASKYNIIRYNLNLITDSILKDKLRKKFEKACSKLN